MMMDTTFDPYDILFNNGPKSPVSEGLLFTNETMLADFNNDLSSISPTTNSENEFDPVNFEKLLNELLSSDPTMLPEQSIELSFPIYENEPPTREIGTDPMESVSSTMPIIIKTTNENQLTNAPIFLIQTVNQIPTNNNSITIQSLPLTTNTNFQFDSTISKTDDLQMDDVLPLTPSTLSNSPDDRNSNSPDNSQDHLYSKMLTNFDNLPTSGKLVLTNEEIKLMKQEGYEIPTKLPLNKTEEKILKKVRRKIKNKISAQESRRKKKEYVDALEKQISKYLDENKILKERVAAIEKSQKTLTQERDLLRSMINKGTPTSSTALTVFAIFFAVLFGIWSPLTNKSSTYDRSLSIENGFVPSNNYQSIVSSKNSLFEQQDSPHSNYVTNNHKSRVLLSIDEYENHHYGPYLPLNDKYKSINQHELAAPGYTYSNSVEKYMNKKIKSDSNSKRSFDDSTDDQISKKLRTNFHSKEKVLVIDQIENDLNQSKPVKIIRVERTTPAIVNDTLKLNRRSVNE